MEAVETSKIGLKSEDITLGFTLVPPHYEPEIDSDLPGGWQLQVLVNSNKDKMYPVEQYNFQYSRVATLEDIVDDLKKQRNARSENSNSIDQRGAHILSFVIEKLQADIDMAK